MSVQSPFLNDKQEIAKWLQKGVFGNYIINDDCTVDVNGSVWLKLKQLTNIPVKFGKVTGDFSVRNNSLSSLLGCPDWVGGDFECARQSDNYGRENEFPMTNLEYSPKVVKGNYECGGMELCSLRGMTPNIGGQVQIIRSNIVTSFGIPKPEFRQSGDFGGFDYPQGIYEKIDYGMFLRDYWYNMTAEQAISVEYHVNIFLENKSSMNMKEKCMHLYKYDFETLLLFTKHNNKILSYLDLSDLEPEKANELKLYL
jgi:hypothetical protein